MKTNKYSLFLVEDSDDDLVLFKWALKRSGLNEFFQISRHFPNGEDAIRHLTEAGIDSGLGPDIVILDIELPGCSGFEVLQRIRMLTPKPAIAVFSSSSLDEDRQMAERRGADLFQTKTYDVTEFARFLNWLGRTADARRQNTLVDEVRER
jgi:CheY-like chemotaxis protein